MKIHTLIALLVSISGYSLAALAQTETSETPGYLLFVGSYKDMGLQRDYSATSYNILYANGFQGSVSGAPGENMHILEGDWNPGRLTLVQFTSEKHAKQYWWDDAHQEAWKIIAPSTALDILQIDGASGTADKLSTMNKDNKAAYLVFVKGRTNDLETYNEQYTPYAADVFRKHGALSVLSSPREETELLHGSAVNGWISVAEFPSKDALTEFWTSDEYMKLSEVRRATGEWSVIRIDPR